MKEKVPVDEPQDQMERSEEPPKGLPATFERLCRDDLRTRIHGIELWLRTEGRRSPDKAKMERTLEKFEKALEIIEGD
jgi:hypothetical protein